MPISKIYRDNSTHNINENDFDKGVDILKNNWKESINYFMMHDN